MRALGRALPPDFVAAAAGIEHRAFLKAGRLLLGRSFVPVVTERFGKHRIALQTDLRLRTGRFGSGDMPRCRRRLRLPFAAAGAAEGAHSVLRAGGSRRQRTFIPLVTERLRLHRPAAEFGAADSTIDGLLIGARLGTGRGSFILPDRRSRCMPERFDIVVDIALPVFRAGVGRISLLRTCGRRYDGFVLMHMLFRTGCRKTARRYRGDKAKKCTPLCTFHHIISPYILSGHSCPLSCYILPQNEQTVKIHHIG